MYHDELITGDVRLVMIVPSWFPKAHVAFDWDRVQGDSVSVVFVLRGTMQVSVLLWVLRPSGDHCIVCACGTAVVAACAAAPSCRPSKVLQQSLSQLKIQCKCAIKQQQ